MDDQNNQGGTAPSEPTAPAAEPTPIPSEPAAPVSEPTPQSAPQPEEKCMTCGNTASGGNCVPCGQGELSCSCGPAAPPSPMGGQGGNVPVI